MERAIALTGGRTTTGVVRIGNTVHRPIGARAAFVHELLRHLGAREFGGAPRLLGVDSVGREMLSFLPGNVPPELGDFSDSQLVAAARLLRQLHDATLDCPLVLAQGRQMASVTASGASLQAVAGSAQLASTQARTR